MYKSSLYFFLSIVALILSQGTVFSQTNPYGIDDEIYAVYKKAEALKASPECLKYVDSALKMAADKGDKKAECVVSCMPLSHYFRVQDSTALRVSAASLRKLAKKNGYTQYYYYADSQEITLALNQGRFDYALSICDRSLADAEKSKDAFGIFNSYKNLAKVYQSKANYISAIRSYQKAIAYFNQSEELRSTQSISQTYHDVARLVDIDDQRIPNPVDTIEYYVQKSYETAKIYSDTTRALAGFALVCIERCDTLGALQYIEQLKERKNLGSMGSIVRKALFFDARVRKDWNTALDIAMQSSDKKYYYQSLSLIYEQMGDYQNAYLNRKQYDHIKDSLASINLNVQIAEYVTSVGNVQATLRAKEKQMRLVIIIVILLVILFISFILFTVLTIRKDRKTERYLIDFNRQLSSAKEAAEAASRMKTLFVQNMSHEVRTPLNAIMGFSQLLAMPGADWSDEEKESYGHAIMTNGSMLTMLIDDILNISDLESGNYSVRKGAIEVKKIFISLTDVIEHRIPSGVEFKVHSEYPDDFVVYTDGGRVQQILVNFLTNACKHTKEGSISLDCRPSSNPEMVEFSVTDTGCGIPKDQAEIIFERFAKLDAFKQGTGIGLHLCDMLSKKMDGRVYVDTSYTDGARFILEIPIGKVQKEYSPLECK